MLRFARFLCLAVALAACHILFGAIKQRGPAHAVLAANGQARYPIVVAGNASPGVKKLAETLAYYLGRIGGAPFTVKSGDGSSGIAVGTAADFPALKLAGLFDLKNARRTDDYLLRTRANGLLIIGATEIAVQHGVWDTLYRLGYRQYFPTSTWEIVPRIATPTLALDTLCAPSYPWRGMFHSMGAFTSEGNNELQAWLEKNRLSNSHDWSFGHVYQELWREYPEVFKQHPEYEALVDGKRQGGNFCLARQGVRDLFVQRSLKWLADHPEAVVVSAEPSDGSPWCQCDDCAKLGTPSDRALGMANEIARAVADRYPQETKLVGLLSYNYHSPAPTSVRAHPRVIIGFAQGFYTGELTGLNLVKSWLRMGVQQFGVYDYLNIFQWSADMPAKSGVSALHRTAQSISDFHANGAVQWMGESNAAFGPAGLGMYLASRVLWDVRQADRVDAIVEDFLTRAFGAVKEPMRRYYHLLDGTEEPLLGTDYFGRMYRCLADASRLNHDPGVRARLDDLILYTRYAELMYAFQGSPAETRMAAAEQVLRLGYRMHRTDMIASRILYYFNTAKGMTTLKLPEDVEFHRPEGQDPWKSSAPFTREELDGMLRDGVAGNPVLEFTPVSYSENLVPITPLTIATAPRSQQFYAMAAGNRTFFIWAPDNKKEIHLTHTAGLLPQYRSRGADRLKLFYPANSTTVVDSATVPATGEPTRVDFTVKKAGLYRLEMSDRGYAVIDAAPGTHFVEKWTTAVHPFGPTGAFWGYIFVPTGTRYIAGYAQDGGSGCLRDSSGKAILTFAGGPFPGYFKVTVPPGQDGTVWKFDGCGGNPYLMTVPPFIARSPEELLIPAEVMKAEMQKQAGKPGLGKKTDTREKP